MKKFWKKTEGFTLVELIVVIAILGILAGVGTVGYSGYIKKANMAADETLVREVQNAAILAVLNDYMHEFSDSVVVKLSAGPAVIEGGNDDDKALVTKAMEDAFGAEWSEMCTLKFSGWTSTAGDIVGNYEDSSFYDAEGKKMDTLLNKVGNLSGALGKFFSSRNGANMPSEIKSVLDEKSIEYSDSTAMANGAIVALAGSIGNADEAVRNNIVTALTTNTTVNDMSADLQEEFYKVYGEGSDKMVTLATAATIYAYAEAFSQYASESGYNTPATTLSEIAFTKEVDGEIAYLSSTEILGNIVTAFQKMNDDAAAPGSQGNSVATSYFVNSEGLDDANTILSVMDALNESSNVLKDNLTSSTFYTDGSAKNLIDSYLAVGDLGLTNGEAAVIVLPNREVTCYLGGILS